MAGAIYNHMTKTQAIKEIKAMPGMTARATGYGGEIRVAKAGKGQEDSAYYTDDANDAVETAKILATH